MFKEWGKRFRSAQNLKGNIILVWVISDNYLILFWVDSVSKPLDVLKLLPLCWFFKKSSKTCSSFNPFQLSTFCQFHNSRCLLLSSCPMTTQVFSISTTITLSTKTINYTSLCSMNNLYIYNHDGHPLNCNFILTVQLNIKKSSRTKLLNFRMNQSWGRFVRLLMTGHYAEILIC
jgi:hypothetical protein